MLERSIQLESLAKYVKRFIHETLFIEDLKLNMALASFTNTLATLQQVLHMDEGYIKLEVIMKGTKTPKEILIEIKYSIYMDEANPLKQRPKNKNKDKGWFLKVLDLCLSVVMITWLSTYISLAPLLIIGFIRHTTYPKGMTKLPPNKDCGRLEECKGVLHGHLKGNSPTY
ncbi:hypothetical protein Cgig2_026375 [Carnegiea gigantea]|uniref:Uncharacterized protein n=1 Tax=Carnegiea gigantea TaxID=171969 RepID=A0A9Q1Q616_9CARY|nr:hypothetical protein Cgig2_026375 [Carnegiea gigantea]